MDKKSPESPSRPENADLLQELEQLRQAISARVTEASGSKGRLIAVFRTIKDLDISDWENITSASGLREWNALPLSGSLSPALAQLHKKLEELSSLSEIDRLTGLLNRRGLERVLEMEIERAQRTRSSLGLALLDLDDFKLINDRYGHSAGDAVLEAFASILKTNIRKTDRAARFGGEEFVLLLPGTGLIQAQNFLKRILELVRSLSVPVQHPDHGQVELGLTCSVGLACFRGRKDVTGPELLDWADKAMYHAKHDGKDRIALAPLADTVDWERDSQVHQDEKQFLLHSSARELDNVDDL
jgi:diguanylate cyclase (GGDEF)-like protein